MKFTKHVLSIILFIFAVSTTFAQRKITGTIYKDGEPAAGIVVEGHKTNDSYYTSFDGKYELSISEKSKWLRFSYGEETKKLDIVGNSDDVINFSWDGTEIPKKGENLIDKRNIKELQQDQVSDFLDNFSLYSEYFKQKEFELGFENWKAIYEKYPYSTAQIYIDGIKMYEDKIENVLDRSKKLVYLDSIMSIYDKRIEYLGNKGDLLGRKAAKYLEVVLTADVEEDELIKGIKKGYGYAQTSMEEMKDETQPAVLVLFLQSAKKLYTLDEINKEVVLDNYEKVMSILEKQVNNEELAEKANQAIPLVVSIIESADVFDCESIESIYGAKIKESPEDVALIKKVINMLQDENCNGPLLTELSEKLYELEPSAESAFNMARLFLKADDNDKAFEYYAKAYNSADDSEAKAKYYFEAAQLSFDLSKYRDARDFAKKAIQADPSYCKAYMMIGEAYAQASKSFEGTKFEKDAVFWVVVDYFKKAAQGNCTSDAKQKVDYYSNYFPKKDEIFYNTLTEGDKYKVGGWINETTTIRAKK